MGGVGTWEQLTAKLLQESADVFGRKIDAGAMRTLVDTFAEATAEWFRRDARQTQESRERCLVSAWRAHNKSGEWFPRPADIVRLLPEHNRFVEHKRLALPGEDATPDHPAADPRWAALIGRALAGDSRAAAWILRRTRRLPGGPETFPAGCSAAEVRALADGPESDDDLARDARPGLGVGAVAAIVSKRSAA